MSDVTVGIIGIGAIGTKLAHAYDPLVDAVVVHDIDADRLEAVDYEAREPAQMARECAFVLITVPTPTNDHGGDVRAVRRALDALGTTTSTTVIIRSTMPPGSTATLASEYELQLIYSPEFLRDRAPVSDVVDRDRTVVAGPEPHLSRAVALFTMPGLSAGEVIVCDDYLTAEIGKYAHNAFFATKVSFANQMRLLCEATDADTETVMDVVTADHRNTGSHLDPTLGPYGGKCLPKDLAALTHFAREQRVPAPLLTATETTNQYARANFKQVDIEEVEDD